MNRTSGRLIFYFNIVLQLSLAGIFLNFFGIPSIQKYLQKETIIVHSEEQTDGIEAPAITMFAVKDTGIGWKTVGKSVTNVVSFKMLDQCTIG